MARYETNVEAGQALQQELFKRSAELKKIYDSKDPKEQKRAEQLKSEIGTIQNQLMGLGTVGSIGQGIAKGVANTALLPLDALNWIAKKGGGLLGKNIGLEVSPSEQVSRNLQNVSKEQALPYGIAYGVGSSWGMGPKLAAANVAAGTADETLFGGTPVAQSILGIGALGTAGFQGVRNMLKNKQVTKLLAQLPEEEANSLRQFMLTGQNTTDPILAGTLSKLRANPKFAEFFNILEKEATGAALAGTRPEVNKLLPKEKAGTAILQATANKIDGFKESVRTAGSGEFKKSFELAGDNNIVDVKNTLGKIDEMIARYSLGKTDDADAAVNFLTKLKSSFGSPDTLMNTQQRITVPQLQAMLSEFGKDAAKGESLITGLSVDSQKVISSSIFSGLQNDLKSLQRADDSNVRAVGNLLQSARNKTKQAADAYQEFIGNSLPAALKNKTLNSMTTDEVLQTVKGLKPDELGKVTTILERTDPESLNLIRQSMYDDFVQSAKTTLPDGTSGINLQDLYKKFNLLDDNSKRQLSYALGTNEAEFASRMKDAENFYKYSQKFAGSPEAGLINPTTAGEVAYGASGGSYTASKVGQAFGKLWNVAKGGLSDSETFYLLTSPETRQLIKGNELSPNGIKTLENLEKGIFWENSGKIGIGGALVTNQAVDNMFTKPPIEVNPITGNQQTIPPKPEAATEDWDIGPAQEAKPSAPQREEWDIGGLGPDTSSPKAFYQDMYNIAYEKAVAAGAPNPQALATLAATQSSIETGYGKALAGGRNYFGIKGGNNPQRTQEFVPGKGMVTITDSFRQYGSADESVGDYVNLLKRMYPSAFNAQNPQEAFKGITSPNPQGYMYMTDPNYFSKLQSAYSKLNS